MGWFIRILRRKWVNLWGVHWRSRRRAVKAL
jgi:hypothetical protein